MNLTTPPAKEKIVEREGTGTWQWIKWFDNTYKFIRGLMDFFDWNTTLSNPPYREGRMFWDAGEDTVTIWTDISNISQHLGREWLVKVVNKTGSTIDFGKAVYISGAQGNRPTVALAKADAESTSANTIGITAGSIANNAEGYVCAFGTLDSFNTSSFSAGDTLFLSATTAGALTNVSPTAPNHSVKVANTCNSTNNGKILVHVDNGMETHELHDVSGTAPSITGQVLVWNNTARYYEPRTVAYGEMYATNISQTVTVASANVAYELTTGLTGGTVLRVTFGGSHYLQVTDPGKYKVYWSMTVDTATAGDEIEGGFMVDGTAQTNGTSHSSVSASSLGEAVMSVGIASLSANSQVSLYVKNETAARNIIVEHASMVIEKLFE